MSLTPCKSCKHQVDTTAKTCPNCGVEKPGVTVGAQIFGLVILAVIVAVFYNACSVPDDKTSQVNSAPAPAPVAVPVVQEAQKAVPERKSLGLKPEQFQSRVNAALSALERPFAFKGKVEQGAVQNVLSGPLGSHASLVAGISKKTGEILDVTVIGTGDGSINSGMEIFMAASAALAAASGADYKDVFKAIPEMMDGAEKSHGGVKLSVKVTESVGTWFIAAPI